MANILHTQNIIYKLNQRHAHASLYHCSIRAEILSRANYTGVIHKWRRGSLYHKFFLRYARTSPLYAHQRLIRGMPVRGQRTRSNAVTAKQRNGRA